MRVAGTPLVERLVLDELWIDVTDRVRMMAAKQERRHLKLGTGHLVAEYVGCKTLRKT
jgi:nucleotidyltransferase/DNA polymerase involved in DNA repair